MRILFAAALAMAAFGGQGAAHAQAQDGSSLAPRVDRLEREMRAVQRKVFSNSPGQLVEPQITPPADTNVPGTPASSVVTDLTLRVSAIEGQIQTITAQAEQNQYRMRQMQQAFDAYRQATEVRLKTLEARVSADAAAASGDSSSGDSNSEGTASPVPTAVLDKPAIPKPSAARAQRLAAIQRPSTGDAAEDGYAYGFRLWQAKLYPEARKALEEVATRYPKQRRASYARNLIGRAYLDENAPSLAAVAFYDNYKKDPNGERAADSLYYLAHALVKLKKPAAEVCKVYDELTQVYSDQLSSEMRAGVTQGRADSRCK